MSIQVEGEDLRVGDVWRGCYPLTGVSVEGPLVRVSIGGFEAYLWPADGLYTIERPEPPVRRWRRTQRWELPDCTQTTVRETSDPDVVGKWGRWQEVSHPSLIRDDIEEITTGADA